MKTHSERITKLTPREWAISIVLHLIIFGLLIWFTPARQILESLGDKNPPPAAKPPRQDPTQVKEVVKAISQEQADAAKERVKKLLDEEKKLDQLAKDRLEDYKKQADTIAPTAAQKALDLLKQIPPGQDATLQAQQQLKQQTQTLLPNGNPPPPDSSAMNPLRAQLAAAQLAVNKTQITTQEQQEKALQLIHFMGQDTPSSQAEQKAIDAENAAATSQQNTAQLQNQLAQNLDAQIGQSRNLTEAKNRIAEKQTELNAKNAELAQDQAAANAAKAQVDAATVAHNQARDQANADNKPESRQNEKNLHQDLDNKQRDLDQATRKQDQAQRQSQELQNQVNDQTGVQRATAVLNDTQAKYNQLQAQLQAAQDASTKAQVAAKQAQSDAITQLAAVANTPAAAPAPQATPAELATNQEPDASTLDGKNLGQLYDTATKTEDRITDKYKVYRATEFASIQKLTLADALQATQVAKPDREKLDAKLLAAEGAEKNFDAYKSEVSKAKQQIQSMVDLGGDMVNMAEAQKDIGKGDANLQEDNYNKMVAGAMEDDNAAGKDLTGMTGEGAAGGAHGHHHGKMVGSSDVDDAADAGKKGGGSGGGDAPPDTGVAPTGQGMQASQVVAELPDMDYANLKPVATRKISESGAHHADWLYVDSWYMIGPFPNAGRANLHTKFPPETVIDLDAAYPGKDGRTLRWVYTQWGAPNLRIDRDIEDAPAIYYAYTELYFDQPRDLWIATGSDDKGTMWINNVMVWNSNDVLKGWEPNEGYRKVHFKQGLNRILYRIENGQLVAAFSLMISAKKG